MRFTCCCSTSGLLSVFFTARSSSSSSGMLLQRKNDSRDARSRSLMRYGGVGRRFRRLSSRTGTGTSGSSGCCECAISMPASKPPLAAPPRYAVSGACRSSSVTGRRYARRASVETIFRRARLALIGRLPRRRAGAAKAGSAGQNAPAARRITNGRRFWLRTGDRDDWKSSARRCRRDTARGAATGRTDLRQTPTSSPRSTPAPGASRP